MKLLGLITDEETESLKSLLIRKHLCEAWLSSLQNRSTTDVKIIANADSKLKQFQQGLVSWWRQTAVKHEWTYLDSDTWSANIETREVYLYSNSI